MSAEATAPAATVERRRPAKDNMQKTEQQQQHNGESNFYSTRNLIISTIVSLFHFTLTSGIAAVSIYCSVRFLPSFAVLRFELPIIFLDLLFVCVIAHSAFVSLVQFRYWNRSALRYSVHHLYCTVYDYLVALLFVMPVWGTHSVLHAMFPYMDRTGLSVMSALLAGLILWVEICVCLMPSCFPSRPINFPLSRFADDQDDEQQLDFYDEDKEEQIATATTHNNRKEEQIDTATATAHNNWKEEEQVVNNMQVNNVISIVKQQQASNNNNNNNISTGKQQVSNNNNNNISIDNQQQQVGKGSGNIQQDEWKVDEITSNLYKRVNTEEV